MMKLRLDRIMFGLMYRVGFTPWDGHPLSERLRALVEGDAALPNAKALDLGCGTGDTAIYLARNGWDVLAVDFVEHALDKARRKARRAGVDVHFLHADATQLHRHGVGNGFTLVTDNGLLHGLSDEARDAYVRELGPLVPEGGRLVILAFGEGSRRGPRGIAQHEIESRFREDWQLVASGIDHAASEIPGDPIFFYDLLRAGARDASLPA